MPSIIEKLYKGSSFLELTKENESRLPSEKDIRKNYTLEILGTGLLKIIPNNVDSSHAYIISTAIHGNETAPIEIVDGILKDFFKGSLQICAPTLFIFGSPKSMNIQKRFVDFNLNRLFAGAWRNTKPCYETTRAEELEKVCYDFRNEFNKHQLAHYDLHTAIKPSKHEKFAIYPFAIERAKVSETQIAFMEDLGCEAVLFSKSKSTTFSCFSANELRAESFTVELGKVWPFGKNPTENFKKADDTLRSLLSGHYVTREKPSESLIKYDVHSSIIKQGSNFKFLYTKDVDNFESFAKDTPLYEDNGKIYKTEEDELALIFPNTDVEIGQRAGLLLRRRRND
ncbi:succinylglutamate desuccinylase [Bacteriovorax sp. Seq25_V]|uniref:succinylglutamate desuccinylase n=1 Tax=Bacteriovorax sp. Seq25_V TaxID=1201288 RepID=UPI000389DEA8|nr:succinylglutamate desuccinylase [Bacteriovorax sp. Seq25_V]EQC47973.1 succinylglutamate desuccinylase [Bacteriovorax sp. Seq25_V]